MKKIPIFFVTLTMLIFLILPVYAGTKDTKPPIIKSTTPTNNQSNIDTNQSINITFNENIYKGDNTSYSYISLFAAGVDYEIPIKIKIIKSVLSIKSVSKLENNTKYLVNINKGSVTDKAKNLFKSNYQLTFTTKKAITVPTSTPKAASTIAPTQTPTPTPTPKAEIINKIKVGDYVNFGRYMGEEILWKCMNNDDAGIMLVSEYILCKKAFDAAESGTADYGTNDVEKFGNNVWSSSNIRQWLNSTSQLVEYWGQPPVKGALIAYKGNDINAYAEEPGFSSNFTQGENDKIQLVKHDGVEDKIFLLSVDEVNNYFGNSNNQRIHRLKNGNPDWYWTRTPDQSNTSCVSSFNGLGSILYEAPYNSGDGILPALYLKTDSFTTGKGTLDDPWKLN